MKLLLIFILFLISIDINSQIKLVITPEGDTVYQMSKEDFNKFYDIMVDASVCKDNLKITEQQLSERQLQIKYLKDSVGNAQHKIDSLNNTIISNLIKKNKPKAFEVKGLFAESNVIYMPIDTSTYFDLGINMKINIFNTFELSPGIKAFYYKNQTSFGPFLRAEIKIY